MQDWEVGSCADYVYDFELICNVTSMIIDKLKWKLNLEL